MKNNKAPLGMSLIELILYIAVSILLFLGITTFLILIVKERSNSLIRAEVENQGAQAMQVITEQIRQADSINSPLVGSPGSSLSLASNTGTLNPTLFNLNSGKISVTYGVSGTQDLTSGRVTISNLIFTNLSQGVTPGIIRVQFTVTYKNYAKTFYNSASLR